MTLPEKEECLFVTLSEQEECFVDTALDSSSEEMHRSELDSGVFSKTERNRSQSTTCSAEEHTKDRQDDQKRMKRAKPNGKAQVHAARQIW